VKAEQPRSGQSTSVRVGIRGCGCVCASSGRARQRWRPGSRNGWAGSKGREELGCWPKGAAPKTEADYAGVFWPRRRAIPGGTVAAGPLFAGSGGCLVRA
jgi:hypothetical protein